MKLARSMVVLAVASSALVSCGDPNEPVVGEATPEPMHTPVDERCEEADPELVERLSEGLEVDAELDHPRQVESEELDVSFISAELVGDELDDEPPIGTWAAVGNGPDAELYAVGAVARYHSRWPDGTRLGEPFLMTTDGAEEAQTCVEGATG